MACFYCFAHLLQHSFRLISVAESSLPVFRLAGLTNTWAVSPLTCDLFRGPATHLRTYIQLDSTFLTLRLFSKTLDYNILNSFNLYVSLRNGILLGLHIEQCPML